MRKLAAFVASGVIGVVAPLSSGALVDFNTAGQLASDFTVNNSGGVLSQSATGGVGDSGSVVTTGDSTATYKVSPFSWASGPLEVSVMVRKADATANNRVAVVGFVGADNMSFFNTGTNAFISVRLDTVQSTPVDLANINIQSRGGGALNTTGNQLGTNLSLVDGNWYKLTATFTKLSAANTFEIGVTVQDFGSTGLGLVGSVASLTTTYTHATAGEVHGLTNVYAAFRGTLPGGGPRLDNFTAVVVPEPAAVALLAPAVSLLLRRRR